MEKIFLVVSSWSTPYEEADGYSVNFATVQYNRALAKLEDIKLEELKENAELWYSPIQLSDNVNEFFIKNQQESWFNVQIIEMELN